MGEITSKILVVDDLLENRLVLRAVLGSYLEGCHVVTVSGASEALQAVQRERYNCALVDLHMPGMDGITLCQQLQRVSGRRRLPVILMTAHYADAELRARGIQAGANDFLVRPVDNAELVAKVRVILADSRDRDLLCDSNQELEEMVRERTTALRQSERQLRAILDKIPSLVFLKDQQGKMALVNTAWQQATGLSEAWAIGKTSFDIYPPDIAQQLHEQHKNIMATGETMETENWLPHMEGERLYQVIKIPLRNDQGDIYAVCGVATDITQRRKMEQESQRMAEMLRQRQKLESIGTLAGGIAHDFNNLLAIIVGNAELAMVDGDSCGHSLENIMEASLRGKMLIQQLLAFSRQSPVNRIPLSPVALVSEVLNMLRSTLPSSIQIKEKFIDRTGMVLADATHFHQVVINLCTNAAQAMKEKGGIIDVILQHKNLVDKEAEMLGITPGAFFELTVRDQGCGIESHIRERIFEPFFTTREKVGGTGLGLSVVHGVVRDCGGSILCESIPGKGTSFSLYFPLVAGEEKEENQVDNVPQEELARGKGHVLFVDDEQALVRVGQKILQALGYDVTTATDPQNAWQLFHANPQGFDAVITDQVMPGLGGGELAKRMLALRPDLPIVICTGYSELENREGKLVAPARHVLTKPVSMADFSRVLKDILP